VGSVVFLLDNWVFLLGANCGEVSKETCGRMRVKDVILRRKVDSIAKHFMEPSKLLHAFIDNSVYVLVNWRKS